MKLQAKSLKSSLMRVRVPGSNAPGGGEPLLASPTGNLQALAAELHQSATQGLFEYPRSWVLISKVAAIMLMALAVVTLLRLLQPVLEALRAGLPLQSAGVSLWEAASVVFVALLAIAAGAVLTNLFPSVRVTPLGLGVSELIGWRRIPWNRVGVLRVMELSNERYIVMIPFKGATHPPTPSPVLRLIPVLAGASKRGERGLIITSEINNFDRFLQLVISYVAQAAGQSVPRVEMFIDETAVMPMAQLLLEPDAAIDRMIKHASRPDAFGLTPDDTEPSLPWTRLLSTQALIALPPAILLLVYSAIPSTNIPISWSPLFWAVALLAFGVLELPFMAKLIQTEGDMMVGGGQFARPALAYVELQAPRALLIVLGAILVGVGLPAPVAWVCWLTGIGLTTWLTLRFVRRLYYIRFAQTLLAAIGCLIFQMALFALYIGVS